ncbi:amidohydrolase [candidate division WOR-3 bacterium]|nr:amidohydrolase [candidate division WOR-3 bacterium]
MFDPLHTRLQATALLIENGRIAGLFIKKPQVGSHIQAMNIHGSCLIPGFIDSHTHLVARGLELQHSDLGSCASLNECLQILDAHAADAAVVIGYNWDESMWRSFDRDTLDRKVLDRISRRKPIIMRRVCGHCAVVNTVALKKIPRHWHIVDRRTGWLFEDAALYLNDIFKPDPAMEFKAVDLGINAALRHGITSIHEIGDLDRFALLQRVQRTRGLRLRIAFYVLVYDMDKVIAARFVNGFGNEFLTFAGIKAFMDGSIGARTAGLFQPYQGTRTRGKILMTRRRLADIVQRAEHHDLPLMIHSIGDRTTARVLSVLQQYADRSNRLRHRLEHIEVLDQKTIDRIARLRLIASMQPNFVKRWQHPGGLYEHYMGTRYQQMNCFHAIRRAGVRLTFGSDCMPLGPLYGIQGACEHPFPCGRISRSLAFHLYTQAGAFATGDERAKGQLRKGMFADLVVLDKDPRTIKTLDRLKILMTIVGGKVVYTRRS